MSEFQDIRNCTDVNQLRKIVDHLYGLLDDIDTASDIAKSDDKLYRSIVDRYQKQKNQYIQSLDGQTLSVKVTPQPPNSYNLVKQLIDRIKSGLVDPVLVEGEEICGETQNLLMSEFNRQVEDFFYDNNSDCEACLRRMNRGECKESKRICGHHCECSWTQDQCCWCNEEFGEVDGQNS